MIVRVSTVEEKHELNNLLDVLQLYCLKHGDDEISVIADTVTVIVDSSDKEK